MSEDLRDEGFAHLEAALRGLSPLPPALDRDRLLFRAGQESVPRRGRLWPWTTGLLAAVAAGLAALLVLRPEPPPVERIVYVPMKEKAAPVPPATAEAPAAAPLPEADAPAVERARFGALSLQRAALRGGIDGLPFGAAPQDGAAPDPGPPGPSAVTVYQQLRVALQTGGEL